MSTEIRPIESDGQFWIDISLDGRHDMALFRRHRTGHGGRRVRPQSFHQPVIMQHPAKSDPERFRQWAKCFF
jgi:hypothetical protein